MGRESGGRTDGIAAATNPAALNSIEGGRPRDARRVGFFGGSFDPPHRGHLRVAGAAAERFALELVVFAPVGRQPLKNGAGASFADRLAMTKLACEATPSPVRFVVTGLDGPRADGAPNYTVDALAALPEEIQRQGWLDGEAAGDCNAGGTGSRSAGGGSADGIDIYSIAGADSFLDLRRWHQQERLLRLAKWIVASRPGVALDEAAIDGLRLSAAERQRVHLLPGVEDPVSATDLRRRLAAGEPVGDLLPEPVAEYIRARRLYESVGGAEELP